MPNLKVIFHGLCAFVPHSAEGRNHEVTGITVLLPNVPTGGNVIQSTVQLFPGQEITATKGNDRFFAHRASIRINIGATTMRYFLNGEEIRIQIDGIDLTGNVFMEQNVTGSNRPVNRIANLKDIFADRIAGSKVNPNMLRSANTPTSLNLATRFTFKGGTFAAYFKTLDGHSTLASQHYEFHKYQASGSTTVQKIRFDKNTKSMAGAAAFIKDLRTARTVTIICGTKTFEFTVGGQDIEVILENMPPTAPNTPPPSQELDYTDTDFVLLYRVARETTGFRLPNTTIPAGVQPPLICAVALFHEETPS
ncbi:MAG: hypothetical protein WAQ98_03170 [Blastocatellia bacterium]